MTAADLAPDPEDGTVCADCKAPRNAIHSPLCSVRAGAKPGRTPAPVTAAELGEVEALEPWEAEQPQYPGQPCDVRNARGDAIVKNARPEIAAFIARARVLLPRLAAELRAIESMLAEAGMVRREGDTTRSLLARFIADANDQGEEAGNEADANEHDFAIVLHNTVIVRARLVLATKIQSRLADRVLELGEDLERSRLVNAQAEALMADRERMSRDLARMQLQLMQAQATAIAEGRAAK